MPEQGGRAARAGVAAICCALIAGCTTSDPARHGPLSGGGNESAAIYRSGEEWFEAGLLLRNDGSEPAVLEELTTVDASAGASLRGTYAAGPDRGETLVGGEGWPPPFSRPVTLRPVRGTVVPPRRSAGGDVGVQLFARFAPAPAGRSTVEAYRLRYRVEDRRYSEVFPLRTEVRVKAR